MTIWVFYRPIGDCSRCLETLGESNQVGANTKGGALSCRNTHGGAHSVQDSEDNRGEDGQGGDLIHGERLAGDEKGRSSDNQALNEIFDHTIDNFSDSVVHYILLTQEKKRIGI